MKKMQKAGIVMLSAGVLGGVAPAVVPSVLNLNGGVVHAAEENIVDLHYRFEGKDDLINVKVNIAENPNATVGDYYPLSKDGADLKYITKGKGMMWVYKVDPDHNYRVDHRGDLLSKYAHLHLLGVYTQPNNAGTNAGANNNAGTNAGTNNNVEKPHKVTIEYNLYDDPMSPFSSSSSSKVFDVTPNQPLSDHIPETLPGGYVFAGARANSGGSEGVSLRSLNDPFGNWTNFYVTYPKSKRSSANNNAGTEVKPNNDGNANAGANNNAGTEAKPNNDGNANAGANNSAGTEVKPNNDGNANAGANNGTGKAQVSNQQDKKAEPKKEEPTPTPAPKKEADEDAAIEAFQNKVADLEKEVAELEKFITDNEDNSDAADYIAAAKDKLEAKKAELEKKEAELEEALKGLEPKAESSNGGEKAPVVDELPEFGANNPEIKKILTEMEEIVNKLESGDKDPKLLEKLADLRGAFDILTQNKPAINEVPEYDLSKLPQPGVPTPGVADGNSFGPKTEAKDEAKEGSLPNTGMTTSSTAALGLSLIALVGLAVRRKLNN